MCTGCQCGDFEWYTAIGIAWFREPGRPGLTFDYRLVAPLFDHQGLVARADATASTRVRDLAGRETAQGTLS